jgi:hypothetical protein
MGALDAVARVAHATLLPGTSERSAGWQKRENWLPRIRKHCPDLANLIAKGTKGGAVLSILGLLRNTVHSAGLTSVALVTAASSHERTMIDLSSGLEQDEVAALLGAMDALRGRDAWGVESVGGRPLADPGALLEQLLVHALGLLDALMAATPVESLAGVALSAADLGPRDYGEGAFAARKRDSVRWQLGLGI